MIYEILFLLNCSFLKYFICEIEEFRFWGWVEIVWCWWNLTKTTQFHLNFKVKFSTFFFCISFFSYFIFLLNKFDYFCFLKHNQLELNLISISFANNSKTNTNTNINISTIVTSPNKNNKENIVGNRSINLNSFIIKQKRIRNESCNIKLN